MTSNGSHQTQKPHYRTSMGLKGTPRQPKAPASSAPQATAAPQPRPQARAQVPLAQKPLSVQHSRRPRRDRRSVLRTVLVIALVAVALVGAKALWDHRTVDVTVNGRTVPIRNGSTFDKLVEASAVTVSPGNLVSVLGNVLEPGKGAPFTVAVDGQPLAPEDAERRRVSEGESYTISDGGDLTEPYHDEQVTIAPKLEFAGDGGAVSYISSWGKPGLKTVRTGETSGEQADASIDQPVQNVVVTKQSIHPDDGRKLVALTFDDGPSQYTQDILNILKGHGAVATFFNLGSAAQGRPELAKACADAGNQIASHSMSHPQLTTLGADGLRAELGDSCAAIGEATGQPTTTFRPPYGDFSNDAWLASGGCVSCSVIWNIDTEDWRLPGPDAIVARGQSGVRNGSIILMHDGGGDRSQNIEALPKLIDDLHAQGYTFVTIEELMASDSTIPKDMAKGNNPMPEGTVWPTEFA